MTTMSFMFLSAGEFELLEQREKVAYLERAIEVVRTLRGGKGSSSLDASKRAGSRPHHMPGAASLELETQD
jgi:hypothetical protein